MWIDRKDLDAALREFVDGGHGLVLGRPGAGKTHSLQSLADALEREGGLYLFIAVDELGNATEEELRSALGYTQGNFADQLAQLFPASPAGVLIFDGFDAARNAHARAGVLSAIRQAKRIAPPGWSVIVSVRNYDAAKSPTLLALFPIVVRRPESRYLSPGVSARHFAIPELTDREVAEAIPQVDGLAAIYASASDGFRSLVRVPFNLWLIERVLRQRGNATKVGALESEWQLLDLFWSTHVTNPPDGDERTVILTDATRRMVESRVLSVTKADVFREALAESWRALFSAEVLADVGAGGARVGFRHNILFDYAVSVLAISDDSKELAAFLLHDRTRPLFLRPSLVYYFTRLWYSEREVFWRTFWNLVSSQSIAVRLVARLIPPYVIARECRVDTDLNPLADRLQTSADEAADAILRVLQALRFSEPAVTSPWLLFAKRISATPHHAFAWELAGFLDRSLAAEGGPRVSETRPTIGSAARLMFDWTWRQRQGERGAWYDALAAIHIVPVILKTFETDTTASQAIVRQVLALLEERDFPIRYINALSDGVSTIAPSLPELVADIYLAIFTHDERSEAKTSIGGIVLPLTSTRRQDFSMCRYTLTKEFPAFLRSAPAPAIGVALDIMNHSAIEEHVRPYLTDGASIDQLTESFDFLGKQRKYVADLSMYWGDRLRDEPGEMLDQITEYLAEGSETLAPDEAVRLAADHAATAVTWSFLLQLGSRAPMRFGSLLFELSLARPIQLGSATIQPLGTFIERAYEHWTFDQRVLFEESVLSLSAFADAEEAASREERAAVRVRDRLLARAPRALLATNAARRRIEVLVERDALPENEPLFRVTTSSEAFTEEKWLEEQGVDVDTPANTAIRDLAAPLELFANEWMNKRPDSSAVSSILPRVRQAFAVLSQARIGDYPRTTESGPSTTAGIAAVGHAAPAADERVIEFAWTKLAGAAQVIARTQLSYTSAAFSIVRDALLAAASWPGRPIEPNADEEFTSAFWSPSPRTEAIAGLAYLASSAPSDSTLESQYLAFVSSQDPAERFLALRLSPIIAKHWTAAFWQLIVDRSGHEQNPLVLATLLDALGTANRLNDDRAAALARVVIERSMASWTSELARDLARAVADWLIYLAAYRNDGWAWKVLDNEAAHPDARGDFFDQVVFHATNVITPHTSTDPSHLDAVHRIRTWLIAVSEKFGNAVSIRRKAEANDGVGGAAPTDEEITAMHRAVDQIVARAYFNGRREDTSDRLEQGESASTKTVARDSATQAAYYRTIEPLLRAVLRFSARDAAGHMVPRTAHHFMELLNMYLVFDPAGVANMAADVADAAATGGYQFDSLGVREVVRLVEVVLADHRDLLLEEQPLNDTLRLLDIFAQAGWPEALRLVWRLDEAFR